MKKLNITFCSYPDYSSHTKALYLYMSKKYKEEMNLVWIVNKEDSYKRLKSKKIKVVLFGTNEFQEYIQKTDIFFTTHGNLIEYKTKKSIYIDLWHGIGVKTSGYLINNIKEEDINWINNFRSKVDFMVVPTEFWKIIFSSLFQIDPQRILPLGYPKFDIQQKSKGKENLQKIIKEDINKYKKIIYYMPTFSKRKDRDSEIKVDYNTIFNLKEENIKILNDTLKSNNILLCIKRHPSEDDLYKKEDTDNIKNITNDMLEENNIDIDQIINAADILISDYSSLIIEFLFHRKKVIFIENDINKFIDNRGIIFNDYDFWNEKKSIKTFKELIKEITNDNYIINEEKYNLWFGNLKNGGCKKICEYIFENNKISSKIKNQKQNFNRKTNEEIKIINEKINKLILENEKFSKINYSLNYELNEIKHSRSWKIIQKTRKIYKKLKK